VTQTALYRASALKSKLEPFLDKEYRDEYLDGYVKAGIAYQVHAIRTHLKLTQAEFAAKINKKQSVVSRLENTEYGAVTVSTLLEIAKSLDIALDVRFSSYLSVLTANLSPQSLAVDTVFTSYDNLKSENKQTKEDNISPNVTNTHIFVVMSSSTSMVSANPGDMSWPNNSYPQRIQGLSTPAKYPAFETLNIEKSILTPAQRP
jgi:transcriptional regulator with XRE-family HTH domain